MAGVGGRRPCKAVCILPENSSLKMVLFMLYTEIMNDNRDFVALYNKGKFIASKYIVIYVKPNGRSFNRLGITAGKKIGNAVCRNRAKRLIRLAYREAEINLPIGIDIVIVARQLVTQVKSQELCRYMNKVGVPAVNKIAAGKFPEKKRK